MSNIKISIEKGSYENIHLDFDGLIPKLLSDTYLIEHQLKDITIEAYYEKNISELMKCIRNMDIGRIAYYPFDFSDQSVAFIAIKKINQAKLNVYCVCSITLDVGDFADPYFDPDYQLLEENRSIIYGGILCDISNFAIKIAYKQEGIADILFKL